MASDSNGSNDLPEEENTAHREDQAEAKTRNRNAYWSANIRLLAILMGIWFLISFGAGIIFRPFLDQYMIGGYPLGFWFAQQGSIYGFIILIVIYTVKMRKIERQYDLDD